MGLPLFIAPVESDVARKTSHKNRTTSPPRSSIRRLDRASERERQRNVVRRAAARIYGPVQRTVSTIEHRPLPWIESGAAPDTLTADAREQAPTSVNAASLEEGRRNIRMGQRMEEHMAEVFGPGTGWHNVPHVPPAEEENHDHDLGWWSIDPRGRARHPRIRTPISTRFTRSPDTMEAARARTSSPLAPETQQRIGVARLGGGAIARRHNQATRRGTAMDGLGDRERSLSPEGWDTLLTTLAPDPQAPSANTSFASGTDTQSGSQSAAQPSAAGPFATGPPAVRRPAQRPSAARPPVERPAAVQPPTGSSILPDGFDDAPVDLGCDSGCDHSDDDVVGFAEARRSVTSRSRGEDNGRALRMPRYAQTANREREAARQRFPTFEHPDAPSIAERQALSRIGMPERDSQDTWAGRALIRAEEPGNTNPARHARVMNFSPGAAPVEEDWDGMQHIMRSLAQREDIPEEWWAEAGLSRTLTQHGSN